MPNDCAVKMLPIGSIKPYDKNPRKNAAAVAAVAKSIKEFGFRQPIVVDKQMVVIVGHTRLKAAQFLEMAEVPVVVADMPEDKARAYRIADNKTASMSEWDDDLLIAELSALDDAGYDLEMTGFDEQELRGLLGDPAASEDEDSLPEEPEVAVTKPGDVIVLGGHRLVCGDSFAPGVLPRLMAGQKAAMVFTDPPYNCDYGSSKNPRHKIRSIEGDKQTKDEWVAFCANLADAIREYCLGDCYVWGASGPDGMRQRLIMCDAGIHWSATIVWKKQQLVLTPAKYQRMYEPCFYGWPTESSFAGDRKHTEVWEFNRPTDSKLHPTMKPVALCEHGILNSSVAGDVVLDMFLGSGSTLIACEKTGRRCFGVELSPIYCDVIIKRWEDFTGKKAERQNEVPPA